MVVITISTTDNPCTVYFDKRVPKADYVQLLSCSLCNSWLDLKKAGLNAHNQLQSAKGFPPGYYKPKGLAKTLKSIFKQLNANVTAEANSPTGAVVINNHESEKLQFSQNLMDFLGVTWRVDSHIPGTEIVNY